MMLWTTALEPVAAALTVTLTPSARLGVSFRDGVLPEPTSNYRIWARRQDGHLVTLQVRHNPTDLVNSWVDRQSGNPPYAQLMKDRGVDAVSWENAAGQWEEHAVYVGNDGNLYDWRLLDGVPTPGLNFLPITPEAGHPLTGFVTVARRADNVFIFATTTDFRLYAWEVTNWVGGNAARSMLEANGVSASTMIAATNEPTGAYVRVFYNRTDNTVRTKKFTGAGTWFTTTFDGPGSPDPSAPCGLLAAAEGNIGGTAGYKTYVFCTRTGGTPHSGRIYYRRATGNGNANFGPFASSSWSTKATPSGSVATSGFRLTARRRAEGAPGNNTIEALLLGASYQDLYQVEHSAAANDLGNVTNLGWDGEATAHPGGIVAAGPDSVGGSDAYFIGQAHGANWLYRRKPPEYGEVDPWANYGASRTWKSYATGTIATESSTAMLGGKVAHAAIYGCRNPANCTPGERNFEIKVIWSDDEGDTPTPSLPVTISPPPGSPPIPPAGPFLEDDNWGSSYDPVVDFSDFNGTAFIVYLPKAYRDGDNVGSAVALYTTTDGATFTFQGLLDANATSGCDHPWLAVNRVVGGIDIVHVAWEVGGAVKYVRAPVNDLDELFNPANIRTITAGVLSIPRLAVSQGSVNQSAYVVTPQMICRLPEGVEAVDGHGCHGYLAFGEDYKSDTSPGLAFTGTNRTVRAIRNFSVAVSRELPTRVYYAWQDSESGLGDAPFDMRVAHLDYDPIDGVINPGPIISHIFPADDGLHQAFPELTVTKGPFGWNEFVFLSYYDWGQGLTCNSFSEIDATWANRANRCYRVSFTGSYDRGSTWTTSLGTTQFPWVSDPFYAPSDSTVAPFNSRFIGDYHAVTGDILHSAHVGVIMPVGSTDNDHAANVERGWVSDGAWWPYP